MEKKCADCDHVDEGRPNKCGLTYAYGVMKSCYEERRSAMAHACGREGKHWVPKNTKPGAHDDA